MSIRDTTGVEAGNGAYELGFLGGVGVVAGMGPVAVELEGLYSLRNLGGISGSEVKETRIEIPVTVKASAGMLMVRAGGYYSLALGDLSANGIAVTHASLGLETSDFGLVGGLGVMIPTGAATVAVEARYNYGMKNLATTTLLESGNYFRSIDFIVSLYF